MHLNVITDQFFLFMAVSHLDVFQSYTDGNYFAFTRREPIGVCGQIIPVSWIHLWTEFSFL